MVARTDDLQGWPLVSKYVVGFHTYRSMGIVCIIQSLLSRTDTDYLSCTPACAETTASSMLTEARGE